MLPVGLVQVKVQMEVEFEIGVAVAVTAVDTIKAEAEHTGETALENDRRVRISDVTFELEAFRAIGSGYAI